MKEFGREMTRFSNAYPRVWHAHGAAHSTKSCNVHSRLHMSMAVLSVVALLAMTMQKACNDLCFWSSTRYLRAPRFALCDQRVHASSPDPAQDSANGEEMERLDAAFSPAGAPSFYYWRASLPPESLRLRLRPSLAAAGDATHHPLGIIVRQPAARRSDGVVRHKGCYYVEVMRKSMYAKPACTNACFTEPFSGGWYHHAMPGSGVFLRANAKVMDFTCAPWVKHIANLEFQNVSALIAAAGARMLSTFMDPFTLTFTDFAARLTSPALLDLLRDMLDVDQSSDCPVLTADDIGTLISGMPPPGAEAEHPWLLKVPRLDTDVTDTVVKHSEFTTLLASSLAQYDLGTPKLHVRILQASGFGIHPNTPGTYFVCAWQLSLAQMHRLERRSVDAQESARATNSPSSCGPSSSSATLMQLVSQAQASLAS